MHTLIVWNVLANKMHMYALTKRQYAFIENRGYLPGKYTEKCLGDNYHWQLLDESLSISLHNGKSKNDFLLNPHFINRPLV